MIFFSPFYLKKKRKKDRKQCKSQIKIEKFESGPSFFMVEITLKHLFVYTASVCVHNAAYPDIQSKKKDIT